MSSQLATIMTATEGTKLAPDGQLWVCEACGKRARSRYGFDALGRRTSLDYGWDASCMLNAILCYAEQRAGKWVAVEP